jgi:transposase
VHKTSTAIAKNHGVVVLEKLEVHHLVASAKGTAQQPGKNVRAKASLNRSILDQASPETRQKARMKAKFMTQAGILVLQDREDVKLDMVFPIATYCAGGRYPSA